MVEPSIVPVLEAEAAGIADAVVPLGANLVVVREAPETTTRGGIVIPESSRAAANYAHVLAAGPGGRWPQGYGHHPDAFVPTTVRPGDRVLLAKFAGEGFAVDGVEVEIVHEAHVWAIVGEDRNDG